MSQLVYKLNLFLDTRNSSSDTAVVPFLHVEPLYITIDSSEEDAFKSEVFRLIAERIILASNSNMSDHCDSDYINFRVYTPQYFNSKESSNPVHIQKSIEPIMKYLLSTEDVSIYENSDGKYWSKYYISLNKLTEWSYAKGCKYSIEEIGEYIKSNITEYY